MKKRNLIHLPNYIQLGLRHSAGVVITGSLLLAGSALAVAPANDNFASATELSLNTGELLGTTGNVDATFETSEPTLETPGPLTNKRSVWFKWTPTADGQVTFTTLGSRTPGNDEWDALVGVYTGSNLSALTRLNAVADSATDQAVITVPVIANTTYYIQAMGYLGMEASTIKLGWTLAETAYEAKILTFGPGAVVGDASTGAGSISWSLPYGSNLSTAAPTFTLSPGATCDRTSGVVPTPNLGGGAVLYTVTSGGSPPNIVRYVVNAAIEASLLWDVATAGAWDVTSPNWLKLPSTPSSVYADGDKVTFDKIEGGTINIAAPVAPSSTTVSAASGTYIFDGNGLGGSGSLSKSNAGNLTLTGTHNYTGDTIVDGGSLTIEGPSALSGSSKFSVASGASLNLRLPAVAVLPAPGIKYRWPASPATLTGAGTINASLAGNYDAGLNMNMSAFTGTLNISGGASAIVSVYSPGFVAPVSGTINMINGSTLYLGWLNTTFTTNIKLNGATDAGDLLGVIRGDFATLNGTVTLAASSTFGSVNDSISAFTINSTISDGGNGFGITTLGAGKITLTSPANSYTGTTFVKGGSTLQVNSPGALGGGPLTIIGKFNPNYVGSKTVAALKLAGVAQIASGTYGSTASGATFKNDTSFVPGSTGTVRLGSGGGSPFDTWMSSYTVPVGADVTKTGDADGDGVTNFQEYAFGLNPTQSASFNPITLPLNAANGKFDYTRQVTPASTGIVYTVLTSTDLVTWAPAASTETVVTAGTTQTVTVTVTTPAVSGKLFVKVQATAAP